MAGEQPPRKGRGRYRLHPAPSPAGQADLPDDPGGVGAVSGFRRQRERHGRVLRPELPFVLRDGLPMPGAMPVQRAGDLVLADWAQQVEAGQIAEGTAQVHGRYLKTMVNYAVNRGAELVCDLTTNLLHDWMHSPTAYSGEPATATTIGARRAVASGFFYTVFRLGITDQNPAKLLPKIPTVRRYVNAFTPAQIDRLKDAASFRFGETRPAAAVALTLLGCSSGEVGAITGNDVHLVDMLVRAHGGSDRYTQRWLPIDDSWCFDALAARIRAMAVENPDDWRTRPLVYSPREGTPDDYKKRAAATSRTLTNVLSRAGLKANGVYRVGSITEYVAARIFIETGRVEAVAARLGMKSLDDAAHLVGYDWQAQYTQPGPGEQS